MNFTITLSGEGPDLANALRVLKDAIDGQTIISGEVSANITGSKTPQPEATQYQQPPVYQQQSDNQQQQPIYQPQQQAQQQQPVYQQQQPNQASQSGQANYQQQSVGVPLSTVTYDMAQLSVAATQLMDAGRQPELVSLLAQFGVPALTMLPKEHYGAFATSLRAMGAKI